MNVTMNEARLGDFMDDAVKVAQNIADQASTAGDNPLKAVLKSIEIRTALSAPIVMDADSIWKAARAPSNPNSLVARLKPTLVLDTAMGKKTVAPYGEVAPDEWKGNIGILVGTILGGLGLYTAGGYFLGYRAGQRQAVRTLGASRVAVRRAAPVALRGAFSGVGFGR